MTHNRDLVLIRKLCALGLPAQTLAPSLLPALRQVIPAHSAAVFWVDERFEMTGLYAERLLTPEAMERYYEKHYQQPVTGFPRAFAARAAAADPVSVHRFTKLEQESDYFRAVLSRLDAYPYAIGPDARQILINTLVEEASSNPITLVANWTRGLKK